MSSLKDDTQGLLNLGKREKLLEKGEEDKLLEEEMGKEELNDLIKTKIKENRMKIFDDQEKPLPKK